MSAAQPSRGLLLFAHGARDKAWAAPFRTVLQQARAQRPEWQVSLAFLELMPPDLPSAANELVQGGCARIDIVPLFLGSGGHVKNDLPQLVQRLREQHPGTVWMLRSAIGEHPAVIAAIAQAAVDSTD
jgi:sirohydrochlorin cobaltochelatase